MKILIVDDSNTVRNMLNRVIKEILPEASVVEAVDGKTAFHELTTNSFDLIITDLGMAGTDGLSFVNKVKGNSILKKKAIIFFTSKPEAIKNTFGGTVHIVSKNSGQEGIKKKILEVLGNSGGKNGI